ncbi:fumarylacetoacetate hydrolase family protein [Amycolatopsis pithecellobii]|uniref:Fumarylacetoacetate hydrolase n=1 Tax=Amycolatopsis pithecellobii TaxID=664692 RepID=A0A6N7Z228_9PSEU|nr:fumarylacetoacetate hydrolase family protein [Amycolatopsis pithecellobii]MTD54011.1 fumarylacetoacetate hydrolase [Amycolatopsis pithecellobii]
MRLVNLNNRFGIAVEDGIVDVAEASGGRFGPDPLGVLSQWHEFREWAASAELGAGKPWTAQDLGSPVPNPRQVFAIGLNYRAHAAEAETAAPELPAVFTKFPASIAGPDITVTLPPEGNVDWEVELVVVIGAAARHVAPEDAWKYVAGFTVGQDISERKRQLVGPVAQFSLGKSYEGFSPMGPYLVTLDEVADPADLALSCTINGEEVQSGRTSQMIFDVPALIAHLSSVLTLHPGDVIFTGTPSGVGIARNPPRFIAAGDVLESSVEGLGTIRQRFKQA